MSKAMPSGPPPPAANSRPAPSVPTSAPRPPTSSPGASSPSAASAAASSGGGGSGAKNLATIKVRNVQSSLMYHLMFDGDVGALTGSQLKQHIEGVSGVPASSQTLSINGRQIGSMTTGADVDLKNGSTLMLEVHGGSDPRPNSPGQVPTRTQPPLTLSSDRDALRRDEAAASPVQRSPAGINRSSRTAGGGGGGSQQHYHHHHQHHSSQDDLPPLPPARASSSNNTYYRQAYPEEAVGRMPPPPAYRGDFDDGDVIVDIVEESDAPATNPEVGPGFVSGDAVALANFRRSAADVEEMRLQQQEYVWKLEQVRFETERMNREREMKRQLMELDYEATLIDRDRIELERHTCLERQKLSHVTAQNRVEMEIVQKFFPGAQNLG